MKDLIIWCLLLLLISCTPQYRLNRIIRRHPELARTTTETRIDTIVIQRFDTITNTKIVYHDSTIVINNERVKLQYFYDTLNKEIWHEVECKEIYITDTNIVEIQRIEAQVKSSTNWLFSVLAMITLLLFMLLIFRK